MRLDSFIVWATAIVLALGLFGNAASLLQQASKSVQGDESLSLNVSRTQSSVVGLMRDHHVMQEMETAKNSFSLGACNSKKCIEPLSSRMARVWPRKPLAKWCKHEAMAFENSTATNMVHAQGLVLIKVPKSASSTAAAMALRVGYRRHCNVHWQHKTVRDYGVNLESPSVGRFLMATIRQPSSRALSSFYYHRVSFNGVRKTPKSSFVTKQLKKTKSNFVLDYISSKPIPGNATLAELQQTVNDALHRFDFMMVVERMDESLVVFAWLAGLELADLLSMPSKQGGSYRLSKQKCIPLVKPVLSVEMQQFFGSQWWNERHVGDRLLHEAASRSLDQTIEVMGKPAMEKDLARLRRLRAFVQTRCTNETFPPCSDRGEPQLDSAKASCYTRDLGCGYACIDRITGGNRKDLKR
jgi:hypothetical protein